MMGGVDDILNFFDGSIEGSHKKGLEPLKLLVQELGHILSELRIFSPDLNS